MDPAPLATPPAPMPARERLLDCAERLFGERGLAGVSLRAINAEAGLSPAALHYHFGSKQALVEALLERRMGDLMARRRERLDRLESGPGAPAPRGVVSALVAPLAELIAEDGEAGRRYVRLLTRLRADGDLDEQFVVGRYASGIDRLEMLLARALPGLPRDLVRVRLALVVELMLPALARFGALGADGLAAAAPSSFDGWLRALVDFLTGALEAPVSPDGDDPFARSSTQTPTALPGAQ